MRAAPGSYGSDRNAVKRMCNSVMSVTRCDARVGLCLRSRKDRPYGARGADAARSCSEHYMSDDAKLGLILLFMVFALMVIGPALAG